MLSGIKVGKKKSKRPRNDDMAVPKVQPPPDLSNRDAAAALRAQISAGGSLLPQQNDVGNPRAGATNIARLSNRDVDGDNVVVLTGKAVVSSSRPEYQVEDFRSGARKGKVKRKAVDTIGTTHDEATMSIQDMLRAEKEQDHSMDEIYARNVARMGSRFKGTELKAGSSAGADEEDFVDVKIFQKQNLTKVAGAHRETSRQLARHDRQSAIAAKCWWWMESPTFRKHMLIALGNHVSLVMIPSHLSLFPGNCFYLVPLQHADSLVRCDDNTWDEILNFQTSLRTLFGKEDKDVIFTETVLGTKGFWQTRFMAIPIPRKQNDAPMYFKQAMLEQAEDWGTHNKVLATRDKGFCRTIPVNFNYFHVEWDTNDGFAQIIETQNFPPDFGVDTLAGMLQMDSVRFRRTQRQSLDEEKKFVLNFLERWKTVDWTLELED